MADALALARATTNTQKMKSAMKQIWDERKHLKAAVNETGSFDMVLRGQIDEVFLVLAHLGEAILPLGVFNKDYYLQTLGDVQAAIASCGNELLLLAWAELDAELQYVCTAGMAFCACYAPMPVYRGFGACVLSDYDWACPDMAYLEEKAKKKAIWTVYGVKQRVEVQPTRSIFQSFDQAIQLLQVKPISFLEKRPVVSGFTEHLPQYGLKPKREVKDDLEVLENWVKQLERHGHPGPMESKTTSWGIPFATWTSPYSCHIMKTSRDCETIAYHQMDPGRLLHGFLCRGNANLDDGQILMLLPGSPAESILSWLEGLPGISHKIIRWQDLETAAFESKIGKSLRKKIGRYPLPTQFAVRDSRASTSPMGSTSSPSVLEHPNTVTPPPYTQGTVSKQTPTAELGLPDPREMPATSVNQQLTLSGELTAAVVHRQISGLPGGIARIGVAAGLKSIHTLRRMPSGPPAATVMSYSSTSAAIGRESRVESGPIGELDSQPRAVELQTESAAIEVTASTAERTAELPTQARRKGTSAQHSVPSASQQYAPEQPGETTDDTSAYIEEPAGGSSDNATASTSHSTALDGSRAELVAASSDENSVTSAARLTAAQTIIAKRKPLPAVSSKEPRATETISCATKEESSEADSQSTADEYLDLLKQVAKGELSPLMLSKLLQNKGLLQA